MNPGRDGGGEEGTMTKEWISFQREGVTSTYEGAVIPDHPALPAIARWLQAHPDAATAVDRCLHSAMDTEAFGCFDVYESDRETVRSLIDALTPDAPVTEGDR